ncbi:hypothetical protein OsI_26798 [Oryza sativa Indica Group]|uniref:Uncharacterized protein n=1 Tax=Oryza sativa subsp. indica TaxID=39946 RepID=B8B8B4_ORYSI|nr:hypothetical protein OsI_26798 [Oryza sativa Indica Group]
MVDEILDASKQGNTTRRRCRFALLNDCTKPLESFTHSPVKIRALRFLGSDKNVLHGASLSPARYLRSLVCGKTGFHNDLFSSAKYLYVLDLSECLIQKLPDSIGHLKQLRYLNAPKGPTTSDSQLCHQALKTNLPQPSRVFYNLEPARVDGRDGSSDVS